MRKRGIIGTLLLLVYLAGVGLFTGPSLAQLLVGHLPQPRLELIPFADMISVVKSPEAPGLGPFVNIAGNIALLFPLGLFLPLFWRWFERAGRTIRWCFGTSLSIELIQLVAGGVTSADDLLLNTLGSKASDESVSQARAAGRGKGRVGSTACLLARHHRGKYNIRSADSVVGDSGSQDRE